MSERDYVISKAFRDMGVEKGLPSVMRAGNIPKGLQAGERFKAHQYGRAASRHYAKNTSHGWKVAEEGKIMRAQSRSGASGYGSPTPAWKKPETVSERLPRLKAENARAVAWGHQPRRLSR